MVRVDGPTTAVKLITVRNYTPLTRDATSPADEKDLLDALLLFFLHLSVRMRLDRLDGIAEIVWAPDSCIAPTIDGFFQGLDLTARLSGFPEDFPQIFRRYCWAQEGDDLRQMAGQITNTVFVPNSEERRVVESHIEPHIEAVFEQLSA